MKTIIAILITTLILSNNAFALKCDKCHKDDKSIENMLNQRGIKTKQELINTLRNGPKAKLHKNLTNEDIEEAGKQLNLK
ncbi:MULTISPECIES: hypothetical protein [Thermodesulfovibrio]|uniref:Cytochrome c domain-containing protein n=1 Tax=Thermodesulfovibrio yellowstonii (strain ATCC 51303 / DSM 11347 / YP87) TaxID=289376 RepID=B5YL61_THEYD|nr:MULTISPECIES: hypothetical protein [Thermodesulfovibrio]ACI21333.1 hypothetical protein THEYE_A1152 [Thermodesulfovibrio yellowstonii DSM 11347]MDI6864086.1 hypothetical protein [Thermodesulfovibrio yellowstonii]